MNLKLKLNKNLSLIYELDKKLNVSNYYMVF